MEENRTKAQSEQMSRFRDKSIRWYVVHTYSGYENKVKNSI